MSFEDDEKYIVEEIEVFRDSKGRFVKRKDIEDDIGGNNEKEE